MSIIPIINLGAFPPTKKYIIKNGELLDGLSIISNFKGEKVGEYYQFSINSSSGNGLAHLELHDFKNGKKLYIDGYAPQRLYSSIGTSASGSLTSSDQVTNRTNLTTTLGITVVTPLTDNEYIYLASNQFQYITYIKNMWIE